MTYFAIDRDGNIGQNFSLDRWGYHAGKSKWPILGTGVSKQLVGIEVCCPGTLDHNGEAWFGVRYGSEDYRRVKSSGNVRAGVYHRFTQHQERALERLLIWLKTNNPSVFQLDLVLGHDEVSPGRKNDPGGSLSCTMPEFRRKLEQGLKLRYPELRP